MKCRICGANLTKENADICVDCYRKYQEEEDLKNDTEVVYSLKADFSIGYELIKFNEIILIVLLAIMGCFALDNVKQAVLCLIGLVIFLLVVIFNDKLKSKNNVMNFYKTKLTYHTKNIFVMNDKTIKYLDIVDVTYYQSIRQRLFKRGDLCIYVKGTLPGGSLLGGAQFKDLKDVKQKYEDVAQLLNIEKRK